MANEHVQVGFSFVDYLGRPASMAIDGLVDSGTTIATLLTDVGTLASKINAITQAKITGFTVGVEGTITSTATAPTPGNMGVLVTMETSVPRDQGYWIPAMDPTLIVGGKVNIASGPILAFANELITPSGSVTWETPGRDAFTALESADFRERKLRGGPSLKSANPV